ncbi:MAG: hypothetical protein FD147_1592 [Chloroflexi bacterium]|nr:MAG: hypothetical protein FD147_1592 [Chloroflexota bacterium]
MKNNSKQVLFGVLLVLAGIVFLIQQLFHLPVGGLFVSLFFAAGGVVFLYVVFRNHENWWAFIPGFTLLGLGALIASGDLFPEFSNQFGASLFLGSIALSFIAILLVKSSNWWAVIPAGALATLALIAGIQNGDGLLQGGLFFLGIGATFAAVGLLPVGQKEKWPWIPAAICFVLGTLIMIGSGALVNSVFGWIWAVAFLSVGIYLVVRSFLKKD